MSISTLRNAVWSNLLRPVASTFTRSETTLTSPRWHIPALTQTTVSLSTKTQPIKLSRSELFEELTDEYLSPSQRQGPVNVGIEPVQEAATNADADASIVLVRLIEKTDFVSAETTRKDFVELGIPITPNSVYADAAIFALNNLKGEDRRKSFLAWWSVVPREEWEGGYKRVLSLIQDCRDWTLIRDFSLYCAAQGFDDVVGRSLLPFVVRYADVSISKPFVDEFVKAVKQWRPDVEAVDGVDARDTKRYPWMQWFNLAIRQYYLGGRHALAADMLIEGHRNGVVIEDSTYNFFLRSGGQKLPADIHKQISDLEDIDAPDRKKTLFMLRDAAMLQSQKPNLDTLILTLSKKDLSTAQLAEALQFIRNGIRKKSDVTYDFGKLVSKFLYRYNHELGHERAVLILRKRIFSRGSYSAQAIWIAAEQAYYDAINKPLAGLRIFMHYCDLHDFPIKEEVLRLLNPAVAGSRSFSKYDYVIGDSKLPEPGQRIWPYHRNLILAWKAMAQLARDPAAAEYLYSKLLGYCETALDVWNSRESSSTVDLLSTADKSDGNTDTDTPVPNTLRLKPISAFFSPFIINLGQRLGPSRATEILQDMERIGLEPSLDNWCCLAACYSKKGDRHNTLQILDYIERVAEERQTQRLDERMQGVDLVTLVGLLRVKRERKVDRQAHRTIIKTYNYVMRGFMESGMLEAAVGVEKRAWERGYFYKGRKRNEREKGIVEKLARYKKGTWKPPKRFSMPL